MTSLFDIYDIEVAPAVIHTLGDISKFKQRNTPKLEYSDSCYYEYTLKQENEEDLLISIFKGDVEKGLLPLKITKSEFENYFLENYFNLDLEEISTIEMYEIAEYCGVKIK